ncbi:MULTISPECIES: trypsin-like serine peptidase [Streptomyces]|uniref:trypsin-like serine peptidase n=1 Tax=Streptomyces TaxID=1883 RepID=UPI001FD497DB|nr:hypothetical protein [Streptomyces kasugaensis]
MRWRRGEAAAVALGLALCLAAASVSRAADAATIRPHRTRAAPLSTYAPTPTPTPAADPETDPGHHPDPGPNSHPTPHPDPPWTTHDAAAYWTAGRMADAAPPPRRPDRPAGNPQPASTARHFEGIPSVGVLFSVGRDARAHHCTASVVHSPHRNLILTAGHCNPGSHAAFVPQYASGAAAQPYGVWAIGETFAHPGRGTTGAAADLDFAFATVAPDQDGRLIEAVTGGNVLGPTPGYTNQVTVIGYPTVRNDPQDRAVRCDTRTTRLPGTRQLRMECGGFHGGTSGSPWLTRFDERTRTGCVIGVIGGLNGGGPPGPGSDRISYSPYFGTETLDLYSRASQAR